MKHRQNKKEKKRKKEKQVLSPRGERQEGLSLLDKL